MKRSLLTLVSIVALECAGIPLAAQGNGDCASYAATLASGALAQTDSQGRAYSGIQACPAPVRSEGIGRALERRKMLTSFGDLRTEAFAFATRDQSVFDLLASMAKDRTATPTARVLAITTLLAMVDTHQGMPLAYFVRHREGEMCGRGAHRCGIHLRAARSGPTPRSAWWRRCYLWSAHGRPNPRCGAPRTAR
jgi:hypothetical protein